MKGMSGKVLALIATFIIAIVLLVLLWTGVYKFVPILSLLSDSIVTGVRHKICEAIPFIGFLFCL